MPIDVRKKQRLKKRNASKLKALTVEQINSITEHAESRADVPLVRSSQVNMRLNAEVLDKARELAKAQGIPYTTFLSKLLKEDIDRLWTVFKNAG